jgi:hypothetical protein
VFLKIGSKFQTSGQPFSGMYVNLSFKNLSGFCQIIFGDEDRQIRMSELNWNIFNWNIYLIIINTIAIYTKD